MRQLRRVHASDKCVRHGKIFLLLCTITTLVFCDIVIHRIHKLRARGKKLVPSHESVALEDKQKLQMKTFSELAESKGTRISSRKQDDFVGFLSIRSSTSGRWLEKSSKHVGPNFTLKPSTKAS